MKEPCVNEAANDRPLCEDAHATWRPVPLALPPTPDVPVERNEAGRVVILRGSPLAAYRELMTCALGAGDAAEAAALAGQLAETERFVASVSKRRQPAPAPAVLCS
jgi:hypothetical protein